MEGKHPESSVFRVVQWNKQKGNLPGRLCVKGDKKTCLSFQSLSALCKLTGIRAGV